MKTVATLALLLCGTECLGQIATMAVANPSQALRGIPTGLQIELENSGDEPVAVPRFLAIELVTPSGQKVDSMSADPETPIVLAVPKEFGEETVLPAGASLSLYIPLGESLGVPGLFGDPRLWEAGDYWITAAFDDRYADEKQILDPRFISPPAKFTVDKGTDHDQRIWTEWIRSTRGNATRVSWPRRNEIATELLNEAVGSPYWAHLAVTATPDHPDAWLVAIPEILRSVDHPYVHDFLNRTRAQLLERKAKAAAIGGDPAAAASHFRSLELAARAFEPRTPLGHAFLKEIRETTERNRPWLLEAK